MTRRMASGSEKCSNESSETMTSAGSVASSTNSTRSATPASWCRPAGALEHRVVQIHPDHPPCPALRQLDGLVTIAAPEIEHDLPAHVLEHAAEEHLDGSSSPVYAAPEEVGRMALRMARRATSGPKGG